MKWLGTLGAAGALTLFFHEAIFSTGVLFIRDMLRVYGPLHAHWASRVAAGEFPQWLAGAGMGQPVLGTVVSGALHPSNFLYLLLPVGVALKWNVLLCYPAALGGTYLAARRFASPGPSLVAAILFTFGGYLTGISNNLPYLLASSTLPWVLWSADRLFERPTVGRALLAAGLHVLVLFAGDPQAYAVSGAVIVTLAGVRSGRLGRARTLIWCLGLLALSALLAAPQLLPAAWTVQASCTSLVSKELGQLWSVHPLLWLEVALGPIFSSQAVSFGEQALALELLGLRMDSLWVPSLHVGLPVLVLAGLACWANRRERWVWLHGASLVVLGWLSMGRFGGLYGVVFDLLPVWRSFRYPVKLVPFVALGLALAAGLGLEVILRDEARRRRARSAFALSALGAMVLAASEWLGHLFSAKLIPALWNGTPPPAELARLGHEWVVACLASAIVCGAVWGILKEAKQPVTTAALVASALFFYLFALGRPSTVMVSPRIYEEPPPFAQLLGAREKAPLAPGGPRLGHVISTLRVPDDPNTPVFAAYAQGMWRAMTTETQLLWGLEGSGYYLPATPMRCCQLLGNKQAWTERYSKLMSVRYLVADAPGKEQLTQLGLPLLAVDPAYELALFENPEARPRAYLARPRCVASPQAALAELESGKPLGPEEALVECGSPLPVAAEGKLGEARVLSYLPERVELEVNAETNSVLVLSDSYYPGWSATIDGEPAEILPANHVARAVSMSAGNHKVVFNYQTPGLALGTGLGLGALIAASLLALWEWLRGRTRSAPAPSY